MKIKFSIKPRLKFIPGDLVLLKNDYPNGFIELKSNNIYKVLKINEGIFLVNGNNVAIKSLRLETTQAPFKVLNHSYPSKLFVLAI